MKLPILVIAPKSYGKYSPEAIEELSSVFNLKYIPMANLSNEMNDDEIIKILGSDAEAVIIGGYGRISKYIMNSIPSLKIVAKRGIGLDNIDVDAATELGIVVVFARHTMEEISVAEHTVALIQACARRLVEANEKVKAGKYHERAQLIGIELYQKNLGVIGFGAIGRRVAQIMKNGFEMKVFAYDPYLSNDVFDQYGVEKAKLDTILSQSDVITIHTPLTPETRNLINEEQLKTIKDRAIIVNTSRGAVINEKALAAQIKAGKIFASGLDVTANEPPESDNPHLSLDRTLLTPHIAAFTYAALSRLDTGLANDLIAFFKGETPIRAANPEVFDGPLRFNK